MNTSEADVAESPLLNDALTWLAQPAASDPLDELVPLRRHLRNVLSLELPPQALLRIMDLFEPHVARVHEMVFPLLLDAALPLPRNLRVVCQGVIDLHGDLATGFLRSVDQAVDEGFQRPRRRHESLSARAAGCLARQYELSMRVSAGSPPDFWRQIGTLLRGHMQFGEQGAEEDRALVLLQLVMAVHAAQPESLTPREQNVLFRHVERMAGLLRFSEVLSTRPHSWFWMDTAGKRSPTPVVRTPPPVATGLVFYTCEVLAEKTQYILDELAAGRSPREMGLSDRASQTDYRNILHHATRRWLNPPQRRHQRKRGSYRIEVCTRLLNLWSLLRGETMMRATTEWQVMNDSASGYAAMHVSGDMPSLLSGSVIGIRRNSKELWSLCLVRWVRSENPEHLEVGLEVLSPNATAVRIACSSRPAGPVPALLLPPLNGTHRGETLLTERGLYDSGKIALLVESPGRLYVVECNPLPLVVQTSSIELFEFTRVQNPAQEPA